MKETMATQSKNAGLKKALREAAVGAIPGLRKTAVAAFGLTDPGSGTERVVVLAETEERDHAAQARRYARNFMAGSPG